MFFSFNQNAYFINLYAYVIATSLPAYSEWAPYDVAIVSYLLST